MDAIGSALVIQILQGLAKGILMGYVAIIGKREKENADVSKD